MTAFIDRIERFGRLPAEGVRLTVGFADELVVEALDIASRECDWMLDPVRREAEIEERMLRELLDPFCEFIDEVFGIEVDADEISPDNWFYPSARAKLWLLPEEAIAVKLRFGDEYVFEDAA